MSDENEAVDTSSCCASCGVAEIDDIKLKYCDGCDLVRYCSDDCKGDHKSQHEEACKKRAAELREELLFKQPESTHRGDCPICMIPLPLDRRRYVMMGCCSKVICKGCLNTIVLLETEASLCPFCRNSTADPDEESEKLRMKRIEANDPYAMTDHGKRQNNKGDYSSGFEYFTKAAELGNADANYLLSVLYREGKGVEKDEVKGMFHLEEAAIGGHPEARFTLGAHKWNDGDIERAVKHHIIAANLGLDESIKVLMGAFKDGEVSKEDLASALHAHKAAVDATKSPQRLVEEKILSKLLDKAENG